METDEEIVRRILEKGCLQACILCVSCPLHRTVCNITELKELKLFEIADKIAEFANKYLIDKKIKLWKNMK
jgi:hypothetical protein